MNLIDKIKKLSETTASPEVKQICENFLSGNVVSAEAHQALMESITSTEQDSSTEINASNQDLKTAMRNNELAQSKSYAEKLMESWKGLDYMGRAVTPKGVYGSYKDGFEQNAKPEKESSEVLSLLESHSEKDAHVSALFKSQEVENLGIRESLNNMSKSGIGEHHAVRSLITKYKHLLEGNRLPEYILAESFIPEFSSFDWDSTVKSGIEKIAENCVSLRNEIEVSKAIYQLKVSDPTNFYKVVVESLNGWLISDEKSLGLLSRDLERWQFNPVVRNLIHTLKVNESKAGVLNITKKQGESEVKSIYTPVLTRDNKLVFQMSGYVFEADETGVRRLNASQMESLPHDFVSLLESFNQPFIKVNGTGVNFYVGKTGIKIQESNDGASVILNGSPLRFKDSVELGRILHVELASQSGVNPSSIAKDVINVYESFDKIVELDIAKNISSRLYEGVYVNLLKWKNQIYVQRVNEGMRENSFLKTSGSQALKVVHDLLKFDISEGLSQFLEGENKMKAIMINDRKKVLDNMTVIEEQVKKLETIMASNPLYESSTQIKTAYNQLKKELDVLKEKWSAINSELELFENGYEEIILDEGKYAIGDAVRVKESGDSGKVISIDSSSGSYVILTDAGKTGEYRMDEIEDMSSAIKRAEDENELAANENPESNPEQTDDNNGEEEVKEAQQPTFAAAPDKEKATKEDTTIEKKAKSLMSQAPKSIAAQAERSKNDVKNEKAAQLATAPDGKNPDVDFEANKEIGYNLRESNELSKENPNLADAPASKTQETAAKKDIEDLTNHNLADAPGDAHSKKMEVADGMGYNLAEASAVATDASQMAVAPSAASQDKSGANDIEDLKDQNLAEAPGTEGDIDIKVNAEMGYNLDEKAEIAKTDQQLAEAPEAASQDKSGAKDIEDIEGHNLATAPGTEGDVDIKVNAEMGYNLDENDDVKKN
jgi:hypothetical protein